MLFIGNIGADLSKQQLLEQLNIKKQQKKLGVGMNVVQLAFDESSVVKAHGDKPAFIGGSKFGASFVESGNPRNIITDQAFHAQSYFD